MHQDREYNFYHEFSHYPDHGGTVPLNRRLTVREDHIPVSSASAADIGLLEPLQNLTPFQITRIRAQRLAQQIIQDPHQNISEMSFEADATAIDMPTQGLWSCIQEIELTLEILEHMPTEFFWQPPNLPVLTQLQTHQQQFKK